jgi:hypothetical protein
MAGNHGGSHGDGSHGDGSCGKCVIINCLSHVSHVSHGDGSCGKCVIINCLAKRFDKGQGKAVARNRGFGFSISSK